MSSRLLGRKTVRFAGILIALVLAVAFIGIGVVPSIASGVSATPTVMVQTQPQINAAQSDQIQVHVQGASANTPYSLTIQVTPPGNWGPYCELVTMTTDGAGNGQVSANYPTGPGAATFSGPACPSAGIPTTTLAGTYDVAVSATGLPTAGGSFNVNACNAPPGPNPNPTVDSYYLNVDGVTGPVSFYGLNVFQVNSANWGVSSSSSGGTGTGGGGSGFAVSPFNMTMNFPPTFSASMLGAVLTGKNFASVEFYYLEQTNCGTTFMTFNFINAQFTAFNVVFPNGATPQVNLLLTFQKVQVTNFAGDIDQAEA